MIPLLTAEEMRNAEHQAIQGWGMPSLLLQEHAALGALALVPSGEPLHVLAGPGNNGGDALALARLEGEHDMNLVKLRCAPEIDAQRGNPRLESVLARIPGFALR